MKDANIRLHRIESLILRSLSEIFIREKDTLTGNAIISVTEVRLSPDLSLAKAYLSILPVEKRDEIFQHVSNQNKYIRKLLGNKVKGIRKIPELMFFIDDSFDYLKKIEKLIDS